MKGFLLILRPTLIELCYITLLNSEVVHPYPNSRKPINNIPNRYGSPAICLHTILSFIFLSADWENYISLTHNMWNKQKTTSGFTNADVTVDTEWQQEKWPSEGHFQEERFVLYIWTNSLLAGKALSPLFSKQCSSHLLKWYLSFRNI